MASASASASAPSLRSCCMPKPPPFEIALKSLHLSEYHSTILQQRYSNVVGQMKTRAFRLALFFHTARTIVTVGSLIVPALLSVQYTDGIISSTTVLYWTTWIISLMVTMCNGLMSLFKLDKRYYLVHTTLELLVSEGWQYIELTAKYSGFYTPGLQPTHENQFIYFCHAVEKIRMRQVEEEYYKLSELYGAQGNTGGAHTNRATAVTGATAPSSGGLVPQIPETGLNNLIPPTPFQGELARLAPEILLAVQQQLSRNGIEDAASSNGSGGGGSSGSGSTATTTALQQENTQSSNNR